MLFLKRLSDAFEEAQEQVVQTYLDMGKSRAEADQLGLDEDEYDKTFFVPERARWSNLKDLKHNIGSELNKATEVIEEHNPSLEGVLVSIDFWRLVKHYAPDFEDRRAWLKQNSRTLDL